MPRSIALLSSLVLTLFLVACEQPVEQARPVAAAEEPATIALVMKTLTNPFFVEMERGARRAEEELGVHLKVRTAAQETSIEQQIGIVEKLIGEAVDAIVIAPGDSVELIPVLKRARDNGIVVINIDNRLSREFAQKVGLTGVPFISVDNEMAAYRAVKVGLERLDKPTAVAVIEGIRGAANAEERKAGALRAFEESPLAEVVLQETANWKIDEGFAVAAAMFERHPEIGLLFCANDMMAIGAMKYLAGAGRSDVAVIGFDALQDAVAAVQEGRLLATVDQQAAEQGYMGIAYAVKALRGGSVPPETMIQTRIVTRESLRESK